MEICSLFDIMDTKLAAGHISKTGKCLSPHPMYLFASSLASFCLILCILSRHPVLDIPEILKACVVFRIRYGKCHAVKTADRENASKLRGNCCIHVGIGTVLYALVIEEMA